MFYHLRDHAGHAKTGHALEAVNQFLDHAFCRGGALARPADDSGIGHTSEGCGQPDAGYVDGRRYALLP